MMAKASDPDAMSSPLRHRAVGYDLSGAFASGSLNQRDPGHHIRLRLRPGQTVTIRHPVDELVLVSDLRQVPCCEPVPFRLRGLHVLCLDELDSVVPAVLNIGHAWVPALEHQ
jgi:hypothetical protein